MARFRLGIFFGLIAASAGAEKRPSTDVATPVEASGTVLSVDSKHLWLERDGAVIEFRWTRSTHVALLHVRTIADLRPGQPVCVHFIRRVNRNDAEWVTFVSPQGVGGSGPLPDLVDPELKPPVEAPDAGDESLTPKAPETNLNGY